ncbi:MAG TPA: sugar phosphate isomerase/epimerase family protein, partial [bacterium]|nr:sugar phosphate isomerase/epimerase family protein [bacterium]
RSLGSGQTFPEVAGYVAEALQPALEEAGKQAVYICLEPLSRKETNFINTAEQAIQFIKELNHPALGLILDVKAMSDEEKPIPEIIRDSAPWLRHVHFNDTNLLGPGWGQTDFKPILAALQQIGYQHWASLEVFDFSPGPETIAERSFQYLRQILSSL